MWGIEGNSGMDGSVSVRGGGWLLKEYVGEYVLVLFSWQIVRSYSLFSVFCVF